MVCIILSVLISFENNFLVNLTRGQFIVQVNNYQSLIRLVLDLTLCG